jgi:glycosyltransferase involved in cell wall biosynthesis
MVCRTFCYSVGPGAEIDAMPSCVIIVENLPVPMDRRVWQEARALREAGWRVSVICPATERFPARREKIEGIEIFRHSLPIQARGMWGFFLEYGIALFHEFRLLFLVQSNCGFDIIQVCNPPDLMFLVALPWKLFGKRLVFDQHDLCPELIEVKFGNNRLLQFLSSLAERLTFLAANLVIWANETFRELAMARGGKRPGDVVTVYSIPDKLYFGNADVLIKPRACDRARTVVIGYVGIIGDQDGVDNVVRMARDLVDKFGLKDFTCMIVGDGPALSSVKALASELDVAANVTFPGYLTGKDLVEALSTFDIGVIPDPINPCNDKMSMNKVFEYSAMGIPIVAMDLSETRRLLKDAALFASSGDAAGLAEQVARLLQDTELRHALGRKAKALADRDFVWEKEAKRYVDAMTRLLQPSKGIQVALSTALGSEPALSASEVTLTDTQRPPEVT